MSLRVLLVEDSPDDREATAQALSRSPGPPVELRTVDKLRPALEALAVSSFDVVLADLHLPDSDGVETIRALYEGADTPIVAFTSEEDEGIGMSLIAAGADDFYPKAVLNAGRLRQVLEFTAGRRLAEGIRRSKFESRLEGLVGERTAALERALTQMQVATNSVGEVIFLVSVVTGQVVFVNEAYERVFFRDPVLLLKDAADWLHVVHPEDRQRIRSLMFEQTSVPPEYFRYRIVWPSGEIRWMQTHLTTTMDIDGHVEYRAGVVQDITEQVQAENAKIVQLEREKELESTKRLSKFRLEFLNMAAHELATPLTTMRLQISSMNLLAGKVEDSRLKTSVSALERTVARLAGLVQDLVDVGRIQTITVKYNWAEFDLVPVCDSAVQLMKPQAVQANLALEVDAPRSIKVRADKERMTQVIVNLLSNAIKYTPGPGRVDVSLRARDSVAELTVTDTGRGIEAADLKKLFVPFGRVGDTISAKGNGLGLYICKSFVEAHGGSIAVTSKGSGLGTTVTVRTPLKGPGTRSDTEPKI